MKKILLITVIFLSFTEVKAQNYVPMLDSVSNTWYYVFNVIPVRQQAVVQPNCFYGNFSGISNNLSTIGDTVINSVTYKKLLQQDYNNPFNDCMFGYLREDTLTKKVYFMDNIFSAEALIYDFSMVPGDSIYLDFAFSPGYYTSGYFHLDSISNVQLNSITRKIFHLNNYNFPSANSLQWIESIGHPGHLVYTKSGNAQGGLFMFICNDNIARDFFQQLTCFEHNSQKVYLDSCAHTTALNNGSSFFYQDSCTYWYLGGSLDEKNNVNSFKLSPNPLRNEGVLIIESSRVSEAEVYIYSMDGRQLYKSDIIKINRGINKIPILSSEYRHGTYIVEVRSKESSLFQKLVILR